MIVVYNVYKNKKGKASITVQCSGDDTEAVKIKDEFEIKPEKKHEDIANDFAAFINNRSGIRLIGDIEKRGKALRLEAEIETGGTSEQGQ